MNRTDAYAAGYAEGCRWAEADIRDHHDFSDGLRLEASTALYFSTLEPGAAAVVAYKLGRARGYRQTLADYDAGRLTREMFELAPRAPQ